MPSAADRVLRFNAVERAVHWTTAGLVGVLVATATVLYLPSVAAAIGRRALIRDVHVAAGFLLPVPALVALAGRWGAALRADLGELDRWDAADRRWLRSWGRGTDAGPGKFNPGQKVTAAVMFGAAVLMLATGSILHWPDPFPLGWRTGATFVHDWLALLLAALITGHVAMAVAHPGSLRGMVTGYVRPAWVDRHHPRWTPSEMTATTPAPPTRRLAFVAVAGGAVVLAASALSPLRQERADSAAAVARRFQAALERNDLEEAYRLLSPSAQARRSQDAFLRLGIAQQDDRYLDPGQAEPYVTDIAVRHQRGEHGSFSVVLRVTMSDNNLHWRQVDLRRTGPRWAVEHFSSLATDPCRDVQLASQWRCHHR
jgi:formate dehydrogenase subunit gamma